MTVRVRLEDVAWWFHDFRARATFASRVKRMRQRELLDLAHEFIEYWAHLEGIEGELAKIRGSLEVLVSLGAGPA